MFEPNTYRELCRELHASPDKIEEVIAMTREKSSKRLRPLRAALMAAAVLAVMVVGVGAANPEGVQELFYNIASIIQVDQYRHDLTTVDGEKVTVFSIPEASVENRSGRAILVIDGKDAADITDALQGQGFYTYESISEEGTHLTVRVEGTAENWTADVTIGNPDGPAYTFSSDSAGNGSSSAPTAPIPSEDGSYVSSFTCDENTVGFITADR